MRLYTGVVLSRGTGEHTPSEDVITWSNLPDLEQDTFSSALRAASVSKQTFDRMLQDSFHVPHEGQRQKVFFDPYPHANQWWPWNLLYFVVSQHFSLPLFPVRKHGGCIHDNNKKNVFKTILGVNLGGYTAWRPVGRRHTLWCRNLERWWDGWHTVCTVYGSIK